MKMIRREGRKGVSDAVHGVGGGGSGVVEEAA